MEKKRECLILLFLLCGCARQRSVSCITYDSNDTLALSLKGVNDALLSIEVQETYFLPENVLADKTFYNDLKRQFDKSVQLEENTLIRRYGLPVEKGCSFSRTVESLKTKRFQCDE
ncbi:MAG: hypothetical protein K5648_08780 [Erysipelotrichaceae bacterium]|nr:hypothetical protein [Erysipelotrichaceae bacterium]